MDNLKPPIIFLIIIFLFALFSAGTYFKLNQKLTSIINPPKPTPSPTTSILSPTPNPTADWKTYTTYTNVQYNFSLKYPITFNFNDEDWAHPSTINTGTLVGGVVFAHDVIINNVIKDRVTLEISATKTSLSMNDIIKIRCNGYFGDKFSLCTLVDKPIIPDSLQYFDNAHYRSINTMLAHDNLLFEIALRNNNPDRPFTKNGVDMYNQILSTFKFLK